MSYRPYPEYSQPQPNYPGQTQGHSPVQGYSGPPSGTPGPPQGYAGPPCGTPGGPQPRQGYSGPPSGNPGPRQGYAGPPSGNPGPPQGYAGPPSGTPGGPGPPQGYAGTPSGTPGPPQPIQGYRGLPGAGPPRSAVSAPESQPMDRMTSGVQQMNFGPGGLESRPGGPQPSSIPAHQATNVGYGGTAVTSRPPSSNIGPPLQPGVHAKYQPPLNPPPPTRSAPVSNIGPPTQPGEMYRAPLNPPLPMGTGTRVSNIGPPPQPGEMYRAPLNPGPPVTAVQYQPPVSGVQSRGAGSHLPPPASTMQMSRPGSISSTMPSAPPTGAMATPTMPEATPTRIMAPPPGHFPPTQPPPGGPPGPTSSVAPPIMGSGPPTTGSTGFQPLGRASHPLSGHAGQPASGLGTLAAEPSGGLGQPSASLGQPPVGLGQPPVGLGQPSASLGQPPVGSGQPPVGLGQPPGGLGQPPGGLGQPRSGLALGPVSLATPGLGQPLSGQPGSGQGEMVSAPGLPAINEDGFNTTDPLLQPVNLLEQRQLLPPHPLEPPPIVLPNGLGRFAPDHRVFCCTMNAIPATSSLLSKLKLPLAIHLHPYKDMSTKACPVIHPTIIVRCRSCRAYINPYVTFIDSRHWRCNLCFRANTLPEDFDFNPNSGHHGDRNHRLELKKSCIEYIAPSEYMVRPPQPCVYYFVIDVSFTSIESGVLGVVCRCLLDHLDRLPGDARTMVGLLTYNSSLQFYSFPSTDSLPQMMVVSDVEDVFLPCPESLLVNLRDFKEVFRTLLEELPGMFATNQSDRSALGPALQAATKLLHPIGGRITVIQCAMPTIGPGSLKYRDVSPASTKMATLKMAPASDFYKSLALDCNTQQIAIDIFSFSGQFIDLSTLSCAAKFSSGQVFHYHDFHHSKLPARERFQKDFKRYLTRKIGFEAVMRIRCTEGMSLHTFHGNFFVRSTDLLSLPCVNPDLSYTINISIDDDLQELGSVCFQAALLYTSSKGERRIRVHTLCVPVSTQLAHVYARLNVLAITGTLANMGVDRACNATLGDAREALMNTVIDSGKVYRTNLASSRQASQFALPASIKLLPLFVIALLKSLAFTLSTKVSYDRRTQALNQIKCMPLDYFMCLLYPRLYAVHMLTDQDVVEREGWEEVRPPILHLSAEKLNRYGVYLMDYGLGLYLWVCKDASQEYVSKILDVKHFGAIPEIMCELPSLKNECSKLLCKLVRQIRSSRQYILPFQVIREDGPHRLLFIEKLVDDRTEMGTSYYELLAHIARQQTK